MTVLAVLTALAAAVAFGWSTALMHRGAARAPHSGGGLRALLAYVVVQPVWLAGMAASLIGLGLHALALHLGSLALVQPLVVTALVFSFAFRAVLERQLPPPRLIGWVLLTAVGLVVFLVAGGSTSGSASPTAGGSAVMLAVGALVVAGGWWLAHRSPPHRAGLALGVSAGVVFGLIAGVLKATTALGGQLLTSWPPYVLLVLGAAGFVLNQRAYHRAPLASSLPALSMTNPVVALLFGVVAFHERPSSNPVAVAAELAGLVAVLVAIYALAGGAAVPAAV